ncbi:MAG TPA: hypothetical protein VFY98_02190, partial [Intrasporangium sp.]|nr:hypothetical protein [Intrasporangium sp.]
MTTQTAAPARTPREQIQQAVGDRPSSDYVFDVRTAIGWTIVTFGLYAFYVFYQLMRRARDHNRRRVALLLAAQELARQRAIEMGRPEALDQALERVQAEVQALRALDDDFRDPTLWLLGSFLGSGLVWLAEAILLDQDLTRHERHERAAEAELTRVFAELGFSLPASVPVMKQPHNCVRRVVALVATLGLYSLWWAADLMREGNAHLQQDQAWEDALAAVA